jgi:uncharacterized protein YfeS
VWSFPGFSESRRVTASMNFLNQDKLMLRILRTIINLMLKHLHRLERILNQKAEQAANSINVKIEARNSKVMHNAPEL